MRSFLVLLVAVALSLSWTASAQSIAPSVNPSKVVLCVLNAAGTACTPVKVGVGNGLPVTDGGGALTVDGSVMVTSGSVTANQGNAGAAAWPTTLTGLALTALQTIAGFIASGHGQVDVLTLPAVTGTVAVSSVPLSQAAGASDATTLRAVLASSAYVPTADTVAAGGADDSIAAAVGQVGICVQNVDATPNSYLCVGGAAGTAACTTAARLKPADVAGSQGGAVCVPTPTAAAVTVNAIGGTLSYVWWRI